MLIGLTGLKNSGKDTVGAYLVKNHGFERKAFADPLKQGFAALFDIMPGDIEGFKNDPTVMVSIGYKNDVVNEEANEAFPHIHSWSPIRSMTAREALQRFGTEMARKTWEDDFWIDRTLPVEGFYTGRAIVITDVRFYNEANRIHELGGKVVRIIRPEAGNTADIHISEVEQTSIKADAEVFNSGTIEELFKATDNMLLTLTNS